MGKYLADYGSAPIELVRGEGAIAYDHRGRRLIDFTGGWCVATVGYGNAEMAEAVAAQARIGIFNPPWLKSARAEAFAKRLVKIAPGSRIARAFRATSGSEAVEFAIKAARAATGRSLIVSIDGVYHGHTYGAASIGRACSPKMAPCLPGCLKLKMPKSKKEAEEVADHFEQLIKQHKDVAAFVSEPVWTNAGCHFPPEGFYQSIQEICRRHDVLFVMDEVATGFGRFGVMFASELWGLEPDIVTSAKGLTGGYGTMGATLVSEEVYRRARGIPSHPTFGWNLPDLAAAEKNLEIILRDNLVDNARRVGEILLADLKPLESLKKVKQVRGRGMCIGIEFKLPIAPIVAAACYRKGLLVEFTDSRTLFLSPPLMLPEPLAKEGAKIIATVLGKK